MPSKTINSSVNTSDMNCLASIDACDMTGFLAFFFGLLATWNSGVSGAWALCRRNVHGIRSATGGCRAARHQRAQLADLDGAAVVRDGGGIHAVRRYRQGAGRS